MKNSILIIALALFTFSCSNESLEETPNLNVSINQNEMAKTINQLTDNQEFKSLLQNESNQRRGENGNGVFVVDNGFTIIFGFVTDDNKVVFLGPDTADDYIALLPNGNARFFAHSSNPIAFVLDLNTFSMTYSNDCYDNKTGRFNASVTGTFVEFDFPFGTVYFIEEAQTAEVMNGHTKVNDAMMEFDEFGEPIGCSEATDEKTLRVNVVFRTNNDPIINVSMR
jgi:hypothetical protein